MGEDVWNWRIARDWARGRRERGCLAGPSAGCAGAAARAVSPWHRVLYARHVGEPGHHVGGAGGRNVPESTHVFGAQHEIY